MTWDGDPHSVLAVLKHEARLLLSSLMSSRSPSMPSMAPFSLFPCNATPSPWCCQIVFAIWERCGSRAW